MKTLRYTMKDLLWLVAITATGLAAVKNPFAALPALVISFLIALQLLFQQGASVRFLIMVIFVLYLFFVLYLHLPTIRH
jgi:hypothetical protein